MWFHENRRYQIRTSKLHKSMMNIDIREEKRNDHMKKENMRKGDLREVNSNPLMKESDMSDYGGKKEKEKKLVKEDEDKKGNEDSNIIIMSSDSLLPVVITAESNMRLVTAGVNPNPKMVPISTLTNKDNCESNLTVFDSNVDVNEVQFLSGFDIETVVMDEPGTVRKGGATVYYVSEKERYVCRAHYENDMLNGEAELRDQNGRILASFNYRNDRIDGPCVLRYENGLIRFKGELKDGYPNGLGFLYNEEGREVFYGCFERGIGHRLKIPDDTHPSYYREITPSGEILTVAEYDELCQKKKGRCYTFEKGKVVKCSMIEDDKETRVLFTINGTIVTIYNEDGSPWYIGEFKMSPKWKVIADGYGKMYDKHNKCIFFGKMKNGFPSEEYHDPNVVKNESVWFPSHCGYITFFICSLIVLAWTIALSIILEFEPLWFCIVYYIVGLLCVVISGCLTWKKLHEKWYLGFWPLLSFIIVHLILLAAGGGGGDKNKKKNRYNSSNRRR